MTCENRRIDKYRVLGFCDEGVIFRQRSVETFITAFFFFFFLILSWFNTETKMSNLSRDRIFVHLQWSIYVKSRLMNNEILIYLEYTEM